MAEIPKKAARGGTFLRWLVAAAFVIAVVFSGLFTGLMNRAGLSFLLFGTVAAAFMGFSRREMGAAFRHAAGRGGPREDLKRAAYFWEAAARNAWLLGVLGSALNFTIVLGGGSGGLADVSGRMIQSFIVTFYGLVLSVICLVPSIKIAGMAGQAASPETPPAASASGAGPFKPFLGERIAGTVLFAAVLGLTVFFLVECNPQTGPLPIVKVLLHGPAILIVFGGAIALTLFMGAGGRALTLGFAMTGLAGLLMGFIQSLFGFAHTNLPEVAAALAFIISVSSFTLIGLLAVAAPVEDREVMEGRREGPGALSRMFWAVFPLLAFIFLLLTFIAVITPMKQPGGA